VGSVHLGVPGRARALKGRPVGVPAKDPGVPAAKVYVGVPARTLGLVEGGFSGSSGTSEGTGRSSSSESGTSVGTSGSVGGGTDLDRLRLVLVGIVASTSSSDMSSVGTASSVATGAPSSVTAVGSGSSVGGPLGTLDFCRVRTLRVSVGICSVMGPGSVGGALGALVRRRLPGGSVTTSSTSSSETGSVGIGSSSSPISVGASVGIPVGGNSVGWTSSGCSVGTALVGLDLGRMRVSVGRPSGSLGSPRSSSPGSVGGEDALDRVCGV